ncbi:glyoxalase superfamily protein [Lentibacter sp. XHP0401]|uniref:glyoxalase superfamily protein n=1 Tax=Lentibacter sp. XHP0401 TaxID=2984334 RepID=UPI0021E864FB|nr:glyoxalase superfamily protein [Lentibacter sp. XHP0401]MCV2894432.1 glyoxalase superfamily protein [Lentibacter sp. XHP0401]
MTHLLPSLDALKAQAKALRRALDHQGNPITHSQSLELLAQQLGHRDWNTLHAQIGNQPAQPFAVGQRVSGHYLKQPFKGTIIALNNQGGGQYFRLTLDFDTPVDVITFESMSNMRKRVSVTVGRDGRTVEKTSDGQPHMVLDI